MTAPHVIGSSAINIPTYQLPSPLCAMALHLPHRVGTRDGEDFHLLPA